MLSQITIVEAFHKEQPTALEVVKRYFSKSPSRERKQFSNSLPRSPLFTGMPRRIILYTIYTYYYIYIIYIYTYIYYIIYLYIYYIIVIINNKEITNECSCAASCPFWDKFGE